MAKILAPIRSVGDGARGPQLLFRVSCERTQFFDKGKCAVLIAHPREATHFRANDEHVYTASLFREADIVFDEMAVRPQAATSECFHLIARD